jgi:biopolymer transport protein ExbD
MNSFNRARRRIIRRYRSSGESLNLVPMIDIFTVLVTFLLMTAVFDPTTILPLDLPAPQSSREPPPPGLQLEVTIRAQRIDVGDRDGGILKRIPSSAEGYDLKALSEFLRQVKARYPDKTEATVLLEPDIAYEALVQVMDSVRVVEQERDGAYVQAALFPDISVGDAPQ